MSNEKIRFLEQIVQLIRCHMEVSEVTWREMEQIKITQNKNFISSYLICSFGEALRSVVEEQSDT